MAYKITLQDAFKDYTVDQDKTVSPHETIRRFKEKLKQVDLDILEATVRIDNGRLDIPVYFSLCGKDAEAVIGTRKQMGKGGTPSQAEASAVMELAERFSFFSFAADPRNFRLDTYGNLKDRALPFDTIALSVHDDSEDLDRAREIFNGLPLKWARGYNLTRQQEVLIPFDWFFAINQFNGPSAGNCVEEALLQGLCEVVERHVSSVISRNRLKTPAVDPLSVTDPLSLEMIGKYRRAGVRLFITDFTLDTGIPTIGALAFDPDTFPEKSEIVWTAGTTPNPHKALNRALTEVAQLGGDFNTGSNYVASGLPKFSSLEEARFVMHPERKTDMSRLPDLSDDNMRVEVENCVAALSRIGLEVLAIDTMNPRLEIPAFYTIIPGAHFRERAAGTSVGMFSAKLISENPDTLWAVSELEKMDRLMPGKYYVKFYLGTLALRQERLEAALHLFEEALALEPKEEDIPSIYSYMALAYKEMNHYRKALRALEQAEAHDKDRTDIHNLMGYCFFKLKEHEKAIECFRRVLELEPGSAIDYANIASNYREMGRMEEAVTYYRFALELDPNIDFARENLRKLEKKAG